MRKIPTLFERSEDRRHVIDVVTPGCEWVLAGEGVATRKFDGTCVMFDGARWWTRREVKPGKGPPDGFVEVEHDPATGKTFGWEPAEQSGFARYVDEAIDFTDWTTVVVGVFPEPGTYELIGPKVNGNPEGADHHEFVRHGQYVIDEQWIDIRFYAGVRDYLRANPWEGIVFHHPDGRMAKIKKRDFPK